MLLEATVLTMWMRGWSFFLGDWPALWAMARIVMLPRCRTRCAEPTSRSRVRKVAILARTGEKGRALTAARNAPVPITEHIAQEIKNLYPDPEPPVSASAPISALFLSEVVEHVPTTPRRMPRLSARTSRHSAPWQETVTSLSK